MVRAEAAREAAVRERMLESEATVVAVEVVPDPVVAVGLDVRPDASSLRRRGRRRRMRPSSTLGGFRGLGTVRGNVPRDGLFGGPRRRGSGGALPILLGICKRGDGPDEESGENEGGPLHGGLHTPKAARIVPVTGSARPPR